MEPPPPTFDGVPSAGVANGTVTLRLRSLVGEAVTVRYTVSTDGTLPPAVTSEAPRFGESESFTAGQGETIPYVIQARAYNERGEASETQVVRFTVDREPPPPPTISGVTSGEYYPEQQQFTLSGSDEIYYRTWNGTSWSN